MKVAALAGGVGGAKLVDGLARLLSPEEFSVIVNTGDDFQLFGLHISPDLDTICYTLAGTANPETGWGRVGESWQCLEALRTLGAPTWFKLGDRDLATHLERTRRLQAGEPLSAVTADFCRSWGIEHAVFPMSDHPVPTQVKTGEGQLPFQEYFVKQSYQPAVQGFEFQGAEQARAAPGVIPALEEADLVVICPSNPWVSIDPILAVGEIRKVIAESTVIAVTPLIGGKALKGPAAKMYQEMGIDPSPQAVAEHYLPALSGFVLDQRDQAWKEAVEGLGTGELAVRLADTWMKTGEDRVSLARQTLDFGRNLI